MKNLNVLNKKTLLLFLLLSFNNIDILAQDSKPFPKFYDDYHYIQNVDSLERYLSTHPISSIELMHGLITLEFSRYNSYNSNFGNDFERIKELAEQQKSELGKAMYNSFKATKLLETDLQKSFELTIQSKSYFEMIKDTIGQIRSSIRQIIILNNELNQYYGQENLVKGHFEKIISLSTSSNKILAKLLSNIIIIEQDNTFNNNADLSAELVAFDKSIHLINKNPQYEFLRDVFYATMSSTYGNVGSLKKMLEYRKLAYEIAKKNKKNISPGMEYNLGINYFDNGFLNLAESHFELAVKQFKKSAKKDLNLLLTIYRNLAKSQFQLKKYDIAWKNANTADSISTKILLNLKEKELEGLKASYEKKQVELERQRLINERFLLWEIIIAGSILVLAIAILAIYLNNAKQKLQEATKFKENIFKVIAHDLKHPITAHQDLADLLNFNLKKKRFEAIESISILLDKSSIGVRLLIDNLFHWLIIQEGKVSYQPKPTALLPCLRRKLDYYEHIFLYKKIKVNLQCSEQIFAFVDVDALDVIFRNLIDNALKAMRNGQENTFTISAEPHYKGKHTIVVFRNSGKKMEQAQIDKINYLFKNVNKNWESTENGGFGLWLVAKFAKINKVIINCSFDILNQETVFRLELPVMKPI